MSLSTLPLSYCTNVHPGRSLDEVTRGLREYTSPTRREFGSPLAAGLWLAHPVVSELLESPQRIDGLSEELSDHDLVCYTLNAFPYGDFHSDRVKEKVYVPDWTTTVRREYTQNCARILARLMPEGTEGSISTVPLGFKQLPRQEDFEQQCCTQLIQLAQLLDELHDDTGRVVRLAIEPEPLCVLETTDETLEFFATLRIRAADEGLLEVVNRHLGVCYDICHQSVEFEDVTDSIGRLQQAGIRINKVHITCAIRLADPGPNREAREALAKYVEPRYLHQTFARLRDGNILATVDLSEPLALEPPEDYRDAAEWRVHFHVPVNAERLGPLATTCDDIRKALTAVAELEYAPHLEVETYTWNVLAAVSGDPRRTAAVSGDPRRTASRPPSLVDGLTAELTATRQLLAELAAT